MGRQRTDTERAELERKSDGSYRLETVELGFNNGCAITDTPTKISIKSWFEKYFMELL